MSEGLAWKLLGVALTLLGIDVPAYVAYDTDDPPPNPEKRLELSTSEAINPLKDLTTLGDRATIMVTVEDEAFDNIVIAESLFKNAGEVPILPNEYHKKLSVSVNAPWKIIAVENQNRFFSNGVPLEWTRVSNMVFEAEPALLNPGDLATARLYLTNTEPGVSGETSDPKVTWSARITHLRDFSKPVDTFAIPDKSLLDIKGIVVFLYGWSVPVLIASAILFHAMYLYLLGRLDWLQEWNWQFFGLVLGTGILSFVAAECMVTYLHGNIMTYIMGVDHWSNAPPLVLHTMLLAFLCWKVGVGTEAGARAQPQE